MPENYFKIPLSVEPKKGGLAEIVPPKILQDLNYVFVIVKDGGEEEIIKVEEPESVLKKIEMDKDCKRLTAKQMELLRKSYPTPKIKKKYRIRPQTSEAGGEGGERFELDDKGNRIIDTFQTVRSGFYLIDVKVLD